MKINIVRLAGVLVLLLACGSEHARIGKVMKTKGGPSLVADGTKPLPLCYQPDQACRTEFQLSLCYPGDPCGPARPRRPLLLLADGGSTPPLCFPGDPCGPARPRRSLLVG